MFNHHCNHHNRIFEYTSATHGLPHHQHYNHHHRLHHPLFLLLIIITTFSHQGTSHITHIKITHITHHHILTGHIRYLTMTDARLIWMPDTFFRNEKIGKVGKQNLKDGKVVKNLKDRQSWQTESLKYWQSFQDKNSKRF